MKTPAPTFVRHVFALLVVTALAACSSPPTIPGARPDLLDFLTAGTTSREETVLRLGQPSSTLLGETVLTYRIGEDPKQGRFVIGNFAAATWQWREARYSLVLVFDANGVLRKHNLVDVK